MEGILEFTAIPAITVIVFLAAQLIKSIWEGEKIKNALPAICGTLGLMLGVVCILTLPEYIPADNWLVAAACGAASGFAATGVHQVGRQIKKGGTSAGNSHHSDGGL